MRRATPTPASDEAEPRIVLTVEISDGSFKSTMSVLVSASEAEKARVTKKWINVMSFGLKQTGDVEIHATEPATP